MNLTEDVHFLPPLHLVSLLHLYTPLSPSLRHAISISLAHTEPHSMPQASPGFTTAFKKRAFRTAQSSLHSTHASSHASLGRSQAAFLQMCPAAVMVC